MILSIDHLYYLFVLLQSFLSFIIGKAGDPFQILFRSDKYLLSTISVIIPARNEEENIGNLLQALQQQTYPKELFEIIVVDDHSTDKTSRNSKTISGCKIVAIKR